MRLVWVFAVVVCVLACVDAALAERPVVGGQAPDFTLKALDGRTVRLSQVLTQGPVVLLVLRGFPGYQCPICNRQVHEFIQDAKGFADAGARVVLVYPGPPQDLDKRAAEFTADKTIPPNFDFLIDPGYTFTNLYDLRWDAPRETAYPSTFLIDRSGKIFFAKISDSHAGRTTAAEVLEALKRGPGN